VFNSELRMGGKPATNVHTRLIHWQMSRGWAEAGEEVPGEFVVREELGRDLQKGSSFSASEES
jgi:hypothetical protein